MEKNKLVGSTLERDGRKEKEGGREGGRKIAERVGETYNGLEMQTFKSKVWV